MPTGIGSLCNNVSIAVLLDESAVALTLRVWAKNADYWKVYFAAQQSVKEEFDRAGVKIPFPQLTVHMDK